MKKILIVIVSFVVAFIVANLLSMAILAIFYGQDFSAVDDPFVMFLLYTITFTLTAVLLTLLQKTLKLDIPSLRPELRKLNLPLIVLGIMALFAFGIVLSPLLNLMPDSNLDALYDMMSGGVWAIITGVVAAPMLEEFLFRGILQRSFIAHSNPIAGIVLASLIFGAVHMIPQQVVSAFCSALVLGTIFFLTGSLTTVVIIHMLNNGLAYIAMMYFGAEAKLEDVIFSSEAGFTTAYVVSVLLLLGLGYWAVTRLVRPRNAGTPLRPA